MEGFVSLGDLIEYVRKFAESRKLFFEERGYTEFPWKKLAILNSKPGVYLKKEFSEKPHIAIYETKFLFNSSERILIVVSLDLPTESIDRCYKIGSNGKLIGGVISRPKDCIDIVWEDLHKLLEVANKEFKNYFD